MNNPKPEHRISAVEKRVTHIEGTIEEMAADTAEEFKALFDHVQKGFDQAHSYIQENVANKQDIARLEETMATKAELTAMEERIKDELRSDLSGMEGRLLDAMKMLFSQRPSE
jgi:uncharacterized coiled-coil protein SlyX